MAASRYQDFAWGLDGAGCQLVRQMISNGGGDTISLIADHAGVAGRFKALAAVKIKSVMFYVNSAIVGSPLITARLETVTNSSGTNIPSGTLVDAKYEYVGFAPSGTAWNTITFTDYATATALTAGTEYAIRITNHAAATTFALRHNATITEYPRTTLTTTDDGATWTEQTSGCDPIFVLVLEDDSLVTWGMCPYAIYDGTFGKIYGSNTTGLRFEAFDTLKVYGVQVYMTRTGSPTGDLRVRIYDTTKTLVTGAEATASVNSLTKMTTPRNIRLFFNSEISLPASGTPYYAMFENTAADSSTNCWNLQAAVAASSTLLPTGLCVVTYNGTTWNETRTTYAVPVELILSDYVAAATGLLVHPGMVGGMHG